MWLQRVLFNVNTRFLGRHKPTTQERPSSPVAARPLAQVRAQAFKERLLAIDRKLAQLKESA